eukprot:gene786-9036_t
MSEGESKLTEDKQELSPEISFEPDFQLVKETNEYPLSTRSIRFAQQFLTQRESNPKDGSTAHLEEESHILFEDWNCFYLNDKRKYHKSDTPEFMKLRDSMNTDGTISDLNSPSGDEPKKKLQQKDIQEIFSKNARYSHVISTPSALYPTSNRGSFDMSTESFKAPSKRISLGLTKMDQIGTGGDDKKAKKSFFSKVFGNEKKQTQSEPQVQQFSFTERVPSQIGRKRTSSKLSSGGSVSRKNSNEFGIGQSFYGNDKETKTSILEILNNERISDNDLQKIQPFLKGIRAVEEDYLENEDDYHKFMSLNNNFWNWVPAEELQCERTRYVKISPYPEQGPVKIQFTFDKFTFDDYIPEPVFLRFALYDVQNKRKISEDFGFELNSDENLSQLDDAYKAELLELRKKAIYDPPKCVFEVKEPNASIIGVLWVDRCLQGDIDEVWKIYKEGKGDKLKKKVKEKVQHLGHIKQPFLFGFKEIFYLNDNKVEVKEGTFSIKELFRVPDSGTKKHAFSIFEGIEEDKGYQNEKNQLDCNFKYDVNPCSSDKLSQFKVDYNKSPSKPERNLSLNQKKSKFLFEEAIYEYFHNVQDFALSIPSTPYLHFSNSFYIYPFTLNLSSKATNLLIKVTFRSDDQINSPAEKRIGDSYSGALKDFGVTSVTYGQKNPQFFDEIRIEPAVPASPKDHLFFEIYDVATNKATNEPGILGTCVMTCIGFAFLPLFKDHAYLDSEQGYRLTVYKQLAHGYLDEKTKLTELPKSHFDLHIRNGTTLYPSDPKIGQFFELSNQLRNLLMGLKIVRKTQEEKYLFFNEVDKFLVEASQFFDKIFFVGRDLYYDQLTPKASVVLNLFFNFMTQLNSLVPTSENEEEENDDFVSHKIRTESTIKTLHVHLFQAIVKFIQGIEDISQLSERENQLLTLFIQNFFENPKGLKKPFYEEILNIWTDFILSTQSISIDNYTRDILASKTGIFQTPSSEPVSPRMKSPRTSGGRKSQENLEKLDAKRLSFNPQIENPISFVDSFNVSWIFFDTMVKSIALYTKTNENKDDFPQDIAKQESFKDSLCNFIDAFGLKVELCLKKKNSNLKHIAYFANNQFALFICDIIQFIPIKYVFEILKKYFSVLDTKKSVDPDRLKLKIEFFTVLLDHDYYMEILKRDSENIIGDELAPLLFECLTIKDSKPKNYSLLRERTLQTFSVSLTKIDFDTRYQTLKDKSILSDSLFLFIKSVLLSPNDILELLDNMDKSSTFFICFYHILYNSSYDKIKVLFRDGKCALGFINLLLVSLVILRNFTDEEKQKLSFTKLGLDFFEKLLMDIYLKSEVSSIPEKISDIDLSSIKRLSNYFDVFDKSCQFLLNLTITKFNYFYKRKIFVIIKKFINDYKNILLNYRELKQEILKRNSLNISNLNQNPASPWRYLLGACLLNSELPSDMTHKSVKNSLLELIYMYVENTEKNVLDLSDDEDDSKLNTTDKTFTSKSLENSFSLEQKIFSQISGSSFESKSFTGSRSENSLNSEGMDEQIEFEQLENNKRQISSATIRRLVEGLCESHQGEDYNISFYKIFFLTYLSFAQPLELLSEIKQVFYSLLPYDEEGKLLSEKVDVKKFLLLAKSLEHWIKEHFDDFDDKTISEFIYFLDKQVGRSGVKNISKIIAPVKKALQKQLIDVQFSITSTEKKKKKPILPPNLKQIFDEKKFVIFEWDSLELARQMTLIDFSLFRSLHHQECFGKKKSWDSPDRLVKLEKAKYITLMTERFNNVSRWIVTTILLAKEPNDRAKIITKFLDIAKHLRELNNFHGLNSIVGAFSSNGIFRLKKTWALIPDQFQQYRDYAALLAHPYGELQKVLEITVPPCIPFLGMYLTHLTFIEQNPNTKTKGDLTLINFKKRILYVNVISNIRIRQQTGYDDIQEVPELIKYLKLDCFAKLMDENEEWDASKALEN